MGRILERKDHTSIYIPTQSRMGKKNDISVRLIEFIIAIGLLLIGAWIIISI